MADIFVSYASGDRDRIKPLVEALEGEGFSVWWDRRIDMGASFHREIERELDAAKCVVVVWSEESVDSDWVHNEAQDGHDRGILVPAQVDDVKLPLAFRGAQTANLVGWPKSSGDLDAFLASVGSCVGTATAAPSRDVTTPPVARKSPGWTLFAAAAAAVLALALGYMAWERFGPAEGELTVSHPADDPGAPRAIAVLPFVNMSPNPDQEFFSDGISDEVLNVLAKVDGLRVTSRTSAFTFKRSDLSVPEIAAQLRVQYVLEGSVRHSGDQVRIAAQLIDVKTDSQLWSETYERGIDNIFAVQDEIAARVADALKVALLGADLMT